MAQFPNAEVDIAALADAMVAGYTAHAMSEIQAFFKRSGKSIIGLTVKDILEEQIAYKLV